MGNCCYQWPYRSKFCPYFVRRNEVPILSANYDTLMDLDYMEEPQLTFRINEMPFTVSSYLHYVSNKPRPNFSIEDRTFSSESSLNCKRGTRARTSLSRVFSSGLRSSAGLEADISDCSATQRLLYHEVDPKGRHRNSDLMDVSNSSSTNLISPSHTTKKENWSAITSLRGRSHKTSTSAVNFSSKNPARRAMSQSFHNDHSLHEEEMDGPEISRLIRRFWPRELNFFRSSTAHSSETGNSRRSLCDSYTSRSNKDLLSRQSSLHCEPKRPNLLHFRSDQSNDGSRTEPVSFAGDVEPSLDLDWDDEPGAFGVNVKNAKNRTSHWFASPFNSEYFDAERDINFLSSVQKSSNTMPAILPYKKDVPVLHLKNSTTAYNSNCVSTDRFNSHDLSSTTDIKQPSLMVDSGFVGYDSSVEQSNTLFSPTTDVF